MIQLTDYINVLRAAIPRFQNFPPNFQQSNCILHSSGTPLMIVAGPGTGKTTVLVLRALRFVFVDGIMPEHIVITTFTRKAADEIRSRLLEWGANIIDYLRNAYAFRNQAFQCWLETVDINRFITGTLDSICEDTLTTFRNPGDQPPVLVEGFVGNALLAREGMFRVGAYDRTTQSISQHLLNYLGQFTRDGEPPANFGQAVGVSRNVIDRLIQDRVDISSYQVASSNHNDGKRIVIDSLQAYRDYMSQTNRMDFAGLEEVFLDRLQQGRLGRFVSVIKSILIDEYQDTNPLQESIYFELLRQTNANLTIVGDDDQSLYRFRGATVELFCNLPNRLTIAVPNVPSVRTEYLVDNYRSTPEIIAFFNNFIINDPNFASARVQPPKPSIIQKLTSNGIPVLGMFRPDKATLAHDLAVFLNNIFTGPGHSIDVGGSTIQINRNRNGGNYGDAVLISDKVRNFTERFRGNDPKPRLPVLLRQELQTFGVSVFNPRGGALRDIPEVQQLLGLLLECIDPPNSTAPNGGIQYGMSLRSVALNYLNTWRQVARTLINTNPAPMSLANFVNAWQNRINQTSSGNWPDEWPILELCYKLITWIPFFQNDPEGQVYLEAISRCIAQASTFSRYRSTILYNTSYDTQSIRSAINDIMVPLAENDIEVDEEIMPHVPRNRLPIMTIHQAKGLEFPLVMVDISSDFIKDSDKQRFRRFPERPSSTQVLEDEIAAHCEIGPFRTSRHPLSRAFDDITRQYYVAYSRAQSILLLVGVNKCLRYNTNIKHIATNWRIDTSWAWRNLVSGPQPTMVNNHPLILI